MTRSAYVYILTNPLHTVLYTGVTSNLVYRIEQHRAKVHEGFTKRYNVTKLVYFETGEDIRVAIYREKQIKAGSRRAKVLLINAMNPEWRDLFDDLVAEDVVSLPFDRASGNGPEPQIAAPSPPARNDGKPAPSPSSRGMTAPNERMPAPPCHCEPKAKQPVVPPTTRLASGAVVPTSPFGERHA
jgi:putative endonuclease